MPVRMRAAMKLGSLEAGPRRPAGRGQPTISPGAPTPAISRRRCRRRSTIGTGSSRSCELLATDLDHGVIPRDRFHEREAAAPLPRAYQWADGSAYVNHVELVRKARGAEMPESFWTDPLMYQGGSDEMLGAARPDPARRRGLGLRPRGRDRGGHRRRAARRHAARRRSATSGWSAWSTTSRCAT